MSSCLSGGGRTYAIDLDLVKSSSSTTTRTSHNTSSSPSSTLSESSNSPLAISTRKPRTPRKRPNQTYNEAAVLLSTAYPNLFSTKQLSKNKNPIGKKFTKQIPIHEFIDDSSDLLFPFRVVDSSSFLLHHQPIQAKPSSHFYSKVPSMSLSCESEIDSPHGQGQLLVEEDFDTESILDEEIEEGVGIDSIMGNPNLTNNDDNMDEVNYHDHQTQWHNGFGGRFEYEYEYGFGLRNGVSAFRNVDDGNWWNFPIVDMLQISPKLTTNTNTNTNTNTTKMAKIAGSNRGGDKKKKQKKVEKPVVMMESPSKSEIAKENTTITTIPKPKSEGLLLKLNYADVLNAWSGRDSPFPDDSPACSSDGNGNGNDLSARLAQIDLFSESGVREASVLRYKEKRRTRLFSKKIRYEVRKVNADQRPRMKMSLPAEDSSSSDVLTYMELAIQQAKLAMEFVEVPVGCVIVEEGKVVASGRNRTNETRNATRHAEMEAIDILLEKWQRDGLLKSEVAEKFSKCILYVTCEPCIMCASALSFLGIKEVYYGCANERFGGCGSILSLHSSSSKQGTSSQQRNNYKCTGGIMADEAVSLFRSFYEQGNQNETEIASFDTYLQYLIKFQLRSLTDLWLSVGPQLERLIDKDFKLRLTDEAKLIWLQFYLLG
ncbi:hypothetical protein ACFE04_028657 [Oxalis oulophora]